MQGPIEFFHNTFPAGFFAPDAVPASDGSYPYSPVKGPGHSDVLSELKKGSRPRCYFDTPEGRAFFAVAAIQDGCLRIESFGIVPNRIRTDIAWLDPWMEASPGHEEELRKEVGPGHPLHGKTCVPVGRRIDQDEFLFRVDGAAFAYAVVHLTWSGKPERDPALPRTEAFPSLADWIDNRMRKDHEEYMRIG
jgi:hypothetical protein